QRLSLPEIERRTQLLHSVGRALLLQASLPIGRELLKPIEVELPRLDVKHVSAGAPRQATAVGTERPSKFREVDIERVARPRLGGVGPQLLQELVPLNDLIRLQQEEGEERALLRFERDHAVSTPQFHRPEDSELESLLRPH